jgi:hypothetical protein
VTREQKIARAADIIGERVYAVDMDRPTMVAFEISNSSVSGARDRASAIAAQLNTEGMATDYGTPLLGAGTWYTVTITVQVGR